MLDDKVTNKYLIIALVIALIVVLYLYSKKKSCNVEGMKNLDLTPVDQAWADDDDEYQYKSVKSKSYGRRREKNNLKRLDESYDDYLANDNRFDRNNEIKPRNTPVPMDPRPDLGNCVPCVCNNDDLDSSEDRMHQTRKRR